MQLPGHLQDHVGQLQPIHVGRRDARKAQMRPEDIPTHSAGGVAVAIVIDGCSQGRVPILRILDGAIYGNRQSLLAYPTFTENVDRLKDRHVFSLCQIQRVLHQLDKFTQVLVVFVQMRGMQCPKMLWLDRHKPGLKVIPPEIQARLDAGNEFGDLAMGMFGPYEEMTIYLPGTTVPDKKAMLTRTQDAMARGVEVICEAAFSNYNNYCAADILRKTETGYDLYEVKNAPEISEQFIKDAGFQYYIITRGKVRI